VTPPLLPAGTPQALLPDLSSTPAAAQGSGGVPDVLASGL
jgi:hypothetical protein